ncbi:MAG: hypothetical protein AB9869_33175 [Verrucomicrobiia bacterium]
MSLFMELPFEAVQVSGLGILSQIPHGRFVPVFHDAATLTETAAIVKRKALPRNCLYKLLRMVLQKISGDYTKHFESSFARRDCSSGSWGVPEFLLRQRIIAGTVATAEFCRSRKKSER